MINEQLSAFLDGELSEPQAERMVAELLDDAAARQAFSRAQWLRQSLRQPLSDRRPLALDEDFSARVIAGLALESDSMPDSEASGATVVPIGRGAEPARRPRRWRQVAGLAVAASVIGAVVLISNPPSGLQAPDSATPTLAATPAPVLSDADVARATNAAARGPNRPTITARRAAAPPDHWSVSDPALEDQLNGYLLEHNGLARGYGLTSATPNLMRVATYGQGPREQ